MTSIILFKHTHFQLSRNLLTRTANTYPLLFKEESLNSFKERKKKNKSSRQKRSRNEGDKVDSEEVHHFHMKDESDEVDRGKRKSKVLGNKKRKNEIIKETMPVEVDKLHNEWESGFDEHNVANEVEEKKRSISRKKKRKHQKLEKAEVDKVDELCNDVKDIANSKNGKSKKAHKMKKKDQLSSRKDVKLLERRGDAEEDEVYQIFAGDDDCSKGMKKWITEYHQSRPGLKILQQRIDDFITTHEAQEEEARKEREAQAAEGGWTVVVHHKGRKKTTDSESGIAVGSVAQAAVMDKMAKKKSKEVGLDFYRFQKREAQRNEIMMLQSKFEQDKKRIQQLRAARKFRPY
ncbi:unnamed protein product [Ilex paraguariensis]|uniref:Ribosomal RNA-processing protein 7 C-terminal domain-containing protein n=1 Tax=Ilex paraguariensis TaxID=185542 RepID=A0ABC8UER8_9AQUA